MWVISAADPAAGVDLVGIDKFVFTQTDQNGQQLLGQDGKPLLDHYELVGYGFGNFRLTLFSSISEDEVNAASKAIFYEMSKGTEMFDLMQYITEQREKAAKKVAENG